MWTIIHVNYFVPIGYHLQDLGKKTTNIQVLSRCPPVRPRHQKCAKTVICTAESSAREPHAEMKLDKQGK